MFRLKWQRGAELVSRIRTIGKKYPQKVLSALYIEAQIELTEMKNRTPVWNPERPVPKGHTPGTLRASGKVDEPSYDGKQLSINISFGGAAEDYALIVHEDLDAYHATGQAKFMESVLKESAPYMADRIAARIQLSDVED